MLVWVILIVVIAVSLWWLKEEVEYETSFIIHTTVSRRVIFDSLKSPVNLEKTHPTVKKVFDIRTENEAVTFQIEDDLGPLGKQNFPMKFISFSEATHLHHIRVEHSSSIADVIVKLAISDYQASDETSETDAERTGILPSVTVRGSTTVRAWRMFNLLMNEHINSLWDRTVRNTIEILGGDSDNTDHVKSS